MQERFLEVLRCPFCGSRLSIIENDALVRVEDRIESGVIGCECCAFPIVAGIPVMLADDATRDAMHALEAGRRDEALFRLLQLDEARGARFRQLLDRRTPATYKEALDILSVDAEGTYFLYRFSDPTFIMSEAILEAVAQQRWPLEGRVLDLCGGSGHLSRAMISLASTRTPDASSDSAVVLADLFFWKLWLATTFTAPGVTAICCDANHPLPFARSTFSMVVLSDAFPYIWHKRMLADDIMRLAGADGVIVLPHLHSSLGENFSAGMTLTPDSYRELFAPALPHLFSDTKLLDDLLERRVVDLTAHVPAADLGSESSLTIVASRRTDLFHTFELGPLRSVQGELRVNPLYQVDRTGVGSRLTLTFPTPEYEEEFGECKRYLPPSIATETDLTGTLDPSRLSPDANEWRRRRIVLDVPKRYV